MVEKYENRQSSDVTDQNRPSKLLSICINGRDDDYMPDFRYRITTTINHLARSLKHMGRLDDVEILVTDWGSYVPMSQTLELSPEAVEITRFIYVPLDVIRATQEGKDNFHTARAANVAIRRARGKYILSYAADTLIQEYSLAQMLRLFKGELHLPFKTEQTYFMIPRFDVPWQFVERRPNLEEWDRYLILFAKSSPLEPVKYFSNFGGAGALLTSHFLWKELRGCDENNTGWGWTDNDLGMRVSQNYPWISLTAFGVFLYHMEHPSTGRRQSALSKPNPHHFKTSLNANNNDWGLGSYELEIQAPQIKSSPDLLTCNSKQHESETSESWPQSFGEIVSELKNSLLIKNVKQMVMSFLSWGWIVQHEELNALFFLSWYSYNHYPRRYLEFADSSSGAVSVAATCPSVEIYKVGHWEGIGPDNSPITLAHTLDDFHFRGYVRFINGDICTALQRLKESFIGPFGFDLMLVGNKMVDEMAYDQICNLIPYLSPGGAFILSCHSTNDFMRIWQKLKDSYSQYTYFQCVDQKTGMVLAAKLPDYNHNQASQTEDILFDTTWFTSTRIKAIFRKILRHLYRFVVPYVHKLRG